MKRPVAYVVALALLCACAGPSHARWKESSQVLNLKEQPLSITEFKYTVRARESTEDNFSVSYKFLNTTDKPILAAEFRILFFDIFDRPLDNLSLYMVEKTLSAKTEDKGVAVFGISNFFLVYKAIAYVSRVRFEDGTIWESDYKEVANSLQAMVTGALDRVFIEGSKKR